MKHLVYLNLLFAFLFAGCRNDLPARMLIDRAEVLSVEDPDSAYTLLDSIIVPDNLNDGLFAHYCMVLGKVADELGTEMPYVSQLIRAFAWYDKQGTAKEQAQIGLYLGRSYVEDKEYAKAMQVYMDALNIAKEASEYNLAGYISSYMGDLYQFDSTQEEAIAKYSEGGRFFLKAGNKRSYALALRDEARAWAFSDSCLLALACLNRADSIAISINDTYSIASISNGLGNVYCLMGDYDKAEKYLIRALELEDGDKAPSYLAMTNNCIKDNNIEKARYYLEKAKIKSKNKDTGASIIYNHYLIEKVIGNSVLALSYLEQFQLVEDSVRKLQDEVNITKVEKEYNYLKIQNENIKLHTKRDHNFILFISTLLLCLIILLIYRISVTHKKKKIDELQKSLANSKLNLLQISNDLNKGKKELQEMSAVLVENEKQICLQNSLEKQENLYEKRQNEIKQLTSKLIQLRKDKLFSSSIAKKINKLSQKVVPGATKPALSEKDWKAIVDVVDETYSFFTNGLMARSSSLSRVEVEYCCLALFQLELTQESILLGINPDSITKKRFRIRQKLAISSEDMAFYEQLLLIASNI